MTAHFLNFTLFDVQLWPPVFPAENPPTRAGILTALWIYLCLSCALLGLQESNLNHYPRPDPTTIWYIFVLSHIGIVSCTSLYFLCQEYADYIRAGQWNVVILVLFSVATALVGA